jgi:hypothetical protein
MRTFEIQKTTHAKAHIPCGLQARCFVNPHGICALEHALFNAVFNAVFNTVFDPHC